MSIFKNSIRSILQTFGYLRVKHISYNADGLIVSGRNAQFLSDARFQRAYRRGMNSGHLIGGELGLDLHIEWRAAICCWAAKHASRLPGDFVECGVNTGMMSLTVCEYVDFNSLNKSFYLFDTFKGIPESQMLSTERPDRIISNSKYPDCYELAQKNFSQFPRANLVRGLVPETLKTVPIEQVAYLSIDMNIAYPERKAIEYFWPKLTPGAIVVLDDYGWTGYEEQKKTMDEFAQTVGVEVMLLPTGQGILLKPPA